MAAGTLAAATFDVPAAGGGGNDVVGFGTLLRHDTLHSYASVRYIERNTVRLVNNIFVRYISNIANRFNHLRNSLTMPSTLGEKLKELRRQKKYSLDELARLSGASKSYLWELENRADRKPSAEKLIDIARVLDTTTDYLVDDNASFDDAQAKEVFFRKFNTLDDATKERVMDMIDVWSRKK
ncbi:helix-turn-helix transcriptional regulator [Rhizobium wenxiniae]